jgi:hypothetical protein
MQDAFGNNDALAGREVEAAILEVDQEPAADHIEEFVFVLVFMPMIFALDHAETHDRFVHLAKGLVIPLVFAGVDEPRKIDHFQRLMQNVEPGVVGKPGR